MYVEGSKPFRHCSTVFAYEKDEYLHIKCRTCGRWVKIGKTKDILCKKHHNAQNPS